MDIEEWWSQLDAATREWLIAHNGEAVPPEVVSEIVASGGVVASDAGWVGGERAEGLYLSDEAIDWIEAIANGEMPDSGMGHGPAE